MTRILLDTNGYRALLDGDTAALGAVGRAEEVCLSVVVIGELHEGFRGGNRFQQNVATLRNFLAEHEVCVLDVTTETAEIFGRIRQDLRRAGTPLPVNDVWLAAQAIQMGAVLVSYDSHFLLIPGLSLWDPLERRRGAS